MPSNCFLMYTFTEENYLKAIHFLSQGSEKGATTNAIAERLETKAASVSDMLKKLSDKDLLIYKKYQGVKLTAKGKEIAIKTVRKHRLWEVFLVDKLGFGWEEVHEVAEQLEHIQSVKLTDRLDSYLGNPKYDPHGDPIPDDAGNFPKRTETTLEECEINSEVIIRGVKDTSPEFLRYLEKLGIGLGAKLMVEEKEEFDGSMRVKINSTSDTSLSAAVCTNLFVKQL